jgi:hypothetical protein
MCGVKISSETYSKVFLELRCGRWHLSRKGMMQIEGSENRMLRSIFGSKADKATGRRRK